ncbi:MAG: glutamine-synthetase adenylyltransferase, partial [Shimia sp.]
MAAPLPNPGIMEPAAAIRRWPVAFDPARGEAVAARYGMSGPLADLVRGTAGCSPDLHDLLIREAEWIGAAMHGDPDRALAEARADGDLHRGKRRSAGLLALLDLGGVWPLEAITGALTDLADAAVAAATATAFAPPIARGKLPEDHGFSVLAMGKMGAGELNYSSDIDLICLFDDARHGAQAGAVRAQLVKGLRVAVRHLSEVGAQGYVFRT